MTPWTAARQAPLSMGLSWPEYWSGLPFPSPVHESEMNICVYKLYICFYVLLLLSLSLSFFFFFGMFSRKFKMLIYTAMIILEVSWKLLLGFSCGSGAKESACNEGDLGLIPGFGRSPAEGEATHPVFWPGEFHGLIVHGVTKSQI